MKIDYATNEKILKRNFREGGIDRSNSKKYNVGEAYREKKHSSLKHALILGGCLGLAALCGTCENESKTSQTNIYNQNYEVSVNP